MEEEKVCCVCLQKSKKLDVTCLKCFRTITEDSYWKLLPTEDEVEYPLSLCNRHRADRNPKYEKVNKHLEEWITCLQCNNNAHKVFICLSLIDYYYYWISIALYIVHFLLTIFYLLPFSIAPLVVTSKTSVVLLARSRLIILHQHTSSTNSTIPT